MIARPILEIWMDKLTVLTVDDDPITTELLKFIFEMEGYNVFSSQGPKEAAKAAEAYHPDLMILDLMMPHLDGSDRLKFCRQVRGNGFTFPILALSGITNVESKIRLLESGGDDYLTKPFHNGEILARAKALIRRSRKTKPEREKILSFGDITVDFAAQMVTLRGNEIKLSRIETELLLELLRKPRTGPLAYVSSEHSWERLMKTA